MEKRDLSSHSKHWVPLVLVCIAITVSSCRLIPYKDVPFPPKGMLAVKVNEPELIDYSSLSATDPVRQKVQNTSLILYTSESGSGKVWRSRLDGSSHDLILDTKGKASNIQFRTSKIFDKQTQSSSNVLYASGLGDYGRDEPLDTVPYQQSDPLVARYRFGDGCMGKSGPDKSERFNLTDLETNGLSRWYWNQTCGVGRLEKNHYHYFLKSQSLTDGLTTRPIGNEWTLLGVIGGYALLYYKPDLILYDLNNNRRIRLKTTTELHIWRRSVNSPNGQSVPGI